MGYFIGLLLGLLLILNRKNKLVCFFAILYMGIMFGFPDGIPDYHVYYNHYYHKSFLMNDGFLFEPFQKQLYFVGKLLGMNVNVPSFTTREPLYEWLVTLGGLAKIEYPLFRFIIALCGLFLLATIAYKYSPYPNWIFLFYLIFPFPIDVVTIRFFLSYSIVLFSIHYIIQYKCDNKKRYILLFILCIICATWIHYSAACFLLLIMFFYPRKYSLGDNQARVLLLLVLLIGVSFVDLSFLGSMKLEKSYLSAVREVRIGTVLLTLLVRCSIVALCLGVRRIGKRYGNKQAKNDNYIKKTELFLDLAIFVTVLELFFELIFDPQFSRFWRVAIISWLHNGDPICVVSRTFPY